MPKKRSRRKTARPQPGNVTHIDDAKALRAIGAPLDTPVEDRELSARSVAKINAARKTTNAFGKAVLHWIKTQDDAKKFAAVCRAWERLADAVATATERAKWVARGKARELANREAVAVNAFIAPCAVICSQWDDILTALKNGEPQRFEPGEAPWPLGPFPEQVRLTFE
jgi:hypothetical protein